MNMSKILLAIFIANLSFVTSLQAVDLPTELLLWDKTPQDYAIGNDVKEQLRSYKPQAGSPSGSNRVFSSVSSPTYSIHRPKNPNGVGLVICPGGGFRDVWIDREGHDLAIWLKVRNITSLVLKYRTRLANDKTPTNTWPNYLLAVQADARQAIKILRRQASSLGLDPEKVGICGFSAGGHLALTSAIRAEPNLPEGEVSGMPDFAGLFYPGIPDDVSRILDTRTTSDTPGICPLFIINARIDKLTPAEKCVDFYAMLLKDGVNAELHIFSKGAHGFDLGAGRGNSLATWPSSFIAWLKDSNIIQP
jgi:acetyl esterase/lipase